MSAECLIDKLKSIFARHGIPETLVTDNGTNYSSELFREFAENWGINHVTVSPRYPKANGLAEKYCGIAKKLMRKALEMKADPHIAIMNYRDTPIVDGKSPAELLMGRKIRTRIPVCERRLKTLLHSDNLQKERVNRSRTQARQYNKTAKPLSNLQTGDKVVMRHNEQWIKGTIVGKSTPRSYEIQTKDKVFRRNRAMIRPDKTVQAQTTPRDDNMLRQALLNDQLSDYQNNRPMDIDLQPSAENEKTDTAQSEVHRSASPAVLAAPQQTELLGEHLNPALPAKYMTPIATSPAQVLPVGNNSTDSPKTAPI